jgi:hypothetical protein
MTMKRTLLTVGKTILGSLAFFGGTVLGGILADSLEMTAPALPAGTDAATLGMYQLLVGLVLAGTLAVVSRRLGGRLLTRWCVLASLSWIAYSLNTYLEAAIFTSYEAASLYTLVMQWVSVVLSSAVVAWLFPPADRGASVGARLRAFIAQFSPAQWAWRLLVALVAFPVVYVVFGSLARPFVIEYYEQQMAGLAAPGWGQIIPTLLLRSLLFLLACLPVLIVWQRSRLGLFITLGSALFILVGGLYMLQSYWYPVTLRVVHSLEILADSFVYAGTLLVLLMKEQWRLAPHNGEGTEP